MWSEKVRFLSKMRQPVRRRTSAFVTIMLAVVDAEDTSLTPLIKCIHLSSHCLRQCPRLGSIQKHWQDLHGVEANFGGHRDALERQMLRSSDRGHTIPRNCHPSYVPTLLRSVHFGQPGFQDR